MTSIWDTTFIVTDVETTGSDPKTNRITEIGCVAVRNGGIKERFTSLINPHQPIPEFIQNMTGITDAMVRRAPEFKRAMEGILPLFGRENTIFVAHNSEFDYRFLKASLQREGVNFEVEKLCTLKLARKLLPQDLKKNVGSLADFFGIPIISRHRALDDAEATAYILLELLNIAENEYDIGTVDELIALQNRSVRTFKPSDEALVRLSTNLDSFPYGHGLVLFNNGASGVHFIARTNNLKATIDRMLIKAENQSKKISDMINLTSCIEFVECATDLHLEIEYAKMLAIHKPEFNTLSGAKLKKSNDEHQNGTVEALKSIMNLEKLLGKDFIDKVARDLTKKKEEQKNLAVILKDDEHNLLCDVFLVHNGTLYFHKTVGKRSDLQDVISEFLSMNGDRTDKDNLEWEIIKKWLEKRRNQSTVIALNRNNQASALKLIEDAIKY